MSSTTQSAPLKFRREENPSLQRPLFEEAISRQCATTLARFKEITRFHALFHIAFFGVAFLELFSFLSFFSFFAKSALLAFSLAALFLTAFSYFVLLFYFQAKKPLQLFRLRTDFIDACKQLLPFEEGTPEYHLHLSESISKLVFQLHEQEYNYYTLPEQFEILSSLMEKFSVWTHWKDLHKMKEILLLLTVQEHLHLVRREPTDFKVHASLASKYMTLAKLYMDPKKQWSPAAYSSSQMQKKFKLAAERAIEEFHILVHYAPQDPWAHAQLASVYRDLEMAVEELREYEILLKLSPQEKEVMLRLGALYFQQGHNAKGLHLYEQLKKLNDPRADELLSFYGSSLMEGFEEEEI